MVFLIYLLIFLFGLIVGSFLNCVIYRLEVGQSFISGRSYCPSCKHTLIWQDLIPVFSFFILKRKCRYCKKPISWQYPIVEISTALIFLLISKQFPIFNFLNLAYYWLIASFLIIIFTCDLKHYIIPDKIIYPAIGITFIYQLFRIWRFGHEDLFGNWQFLLDPLFSAFLAALFFLAIVLVSKGKWMGAGDIKLAFLMGLVLGWPKILAALFLAFFLGAIIGLGLIMSGRKTLKSEIPFGPFLITGTFLALFWGSQIINWYLNFLI